MSLRETVREVNGQWFAGVRKFVTSDDAFKFADQFDAEQAESDIEHLAKNIKGKLEAIDFLRDQLANSFREEPSFAYQGPMMMGTGDAAGMFVRQLHAATQDLLDLREKSHPAFWHHACEIAFAKA